MTIKIKCRIGSDCDHLSKIQMQEVIGLLQQANPKATFQDGIPQQNPTQTDSRKAHNQAAKLASLMNQLLSGDFDAVVINAPILGTRLPTGIALGAITNRLTPYDVMVSTNDDILDNLVQNARIAVNGRRQEAQLLYYRSDLKMMRTRGSVEQMIQKAKSGKVDAAVISAADVERMNKQDFVAEMFTTSICVPAAGQGSLAVLVRSDDEQTKKAVCLINDPASFSEIKAEWAFLDRLGLGEADPVGVLGSITGKKLELEGVVALPDGREKIRSVVKGQLGKEVELGEELAEEILEAGGREFLQELNLL